MHEMPAAQWFRAGIGVAVPMVSVGNSNCIQEGRSDQRIGSSLSRSRSRFAPRMNFGLESVMASAGAQYSSPESGLRRVMRPFSSPP